MTHPDFRALGTELLYAAQSYLLFTDAETTTAEQRAQRLDSAMGAFRAALAEPQQGAPTDEEVDGWADLAGYIKGSGDHPCGFWVKPDDLGKIARAVLTRYAAQAVPVADAVAAERARWFKAVEWALGTGDSDFTPPDAPHGRYWWRKGLAERCGLRWDGTKWVDAEALPLPEAQP